jgi:hypothetical protein
MQTEPIDIRQRVGIPPSSIPHVHEQCIPYIESCGFKFSHRNITGLYVFYRISDKKEVAFTLSEIRQAFLVNLDISGHK